MLDYLSNGENSFGKYIPNGKDCVKLMSNLAICPSGKKHRQPVHWRKLEVLNITARMWRSARLMNPGKTCLTC